MGQLRRLAEAIEAALAEKYPCTAAQLRDKAMHAGVETSVEDVRKLLERHDTFVLAGERPRCWRLARGLADFGTDICAACGQEKSNARFRTVTIVNPVCFDCEAAGSRSPEPRPSSPGPASLFDQASPLPLTSSRRQTAPGYVEANERMVYITGGGAVFHLREDCAALRIGQAEAKSVGMRLHRLDLVPRARVLGSRRPCSSCAS